MGKNKNNNIKEEELLETPPLPQKKRKKKKWPILIIIILAIGILIFFFKKPIVNIMREIPFVGQFIGPAEEEEVELSPDELKAKVSAQASEIEALQTQIEALQANNEALNAKNESLKQYESMYTDFMKQKEDWDAEVAKTNTDLFIDQFEQVYPEAAERIYSTLKSEKILSDKQKELAKTIGAMDEAQAAAALENLIKTDSELIKTIFDGMAASNKALILSEMSSSAAAQVIKLISPDESLAR